MKYQEKVCYLPNLLSQLNFIFQNPFSCCLLNLTKDEILDTANHTIKIVKLFYIKEIRKDIV